MAEEGENRRLAGGWRGVFGGVRADPSWAFFLVFAFSGMVSLPLARASMLLSLVFSLADSAVRRRFRLTQPGFGWLAYFVLAVVVSGSMAVANTEWGVAHGLMPAVDIYIESARGFRKLPKLLWFLAIPLAALQVRDTGRFRTVLRALMAGGCVLALVVVLFHPPLAWLQVHFHGGPGWLDRWLSNPALARWGGRPPTFQYAISALGTMHDAQRLMVALIAACCAIVGNGEWGMGNGEWGTGNGERGPGTRDRGPRTEDRGPGNGRLWAVAAFIALGLVMTCKRGPLVVGIAVSAAVLSKCVRWWRIVALVFLVAAAALAVPQSRARILDLRNEVSFSDHEIVKRGGRLLMWTHIVPALHAEYPRGMGFRALTAIKMHNADWHVEKNRTHVHSVPLQAFVDFGWAGPAVWLLWMALAFMRAAGLKRAGASLGLSSGEAALPLAALSALVVFGLVEYNLADAAVVPLYSIAMGMACFPLYISAGMCEN